LESIQPDLSALTSYLTFQNYLGSQTLFSGIEQIMPGEIMVIENGIQSKTQYWDVHYEIDFDQTDAYFVGRVRDLLEDSIKMHLRSDVEVGAYLSGGVDSSLIASLASKQNGQGIATFHGRYVDFPGYDESSFAQIAAEHASLNLAIRDLSSTGVEDLLRKVIYHLDYPVAGPGALPQFLISELASTKLKVVLGGQGGDEIFGGYARYLIGYLEQCLRAAIDGTSENGNFVVTLESIIPNMGVLREYQPLLQKFWADGLFGAMDGRYLRLINRSADLAGVIRFDALQVDNILARYQALFNSENNVKKEAYFDSMTHFDFKTLLPALLQVEDRMSMAHGLESRVPFLDHPLVEFVATIPADVKFKNGELKRLLKIAFPHAIADPISNRRDKMGFPVPLTEWARGPLQGHFSGLLESLRDRDLPFFNGTHLTEMLQDSPRFSRGLWALISLEVWFQEFHDAHRSSATRR
jgi:asparagine synthase (glutamine-hydrolysing)